jgi:hypothetical protein
MVPRYLASCVVAVVALAGCGGSTIDQKDAEAFVRSYFTPDARSADCPDGVEAKKGETLECTAVDTEGKRFRVTAHVIDSDGRIRITTADVRPAG